MEARARALDGQGENAVQDAVAQASGQSQDAGLLHRRRHARRRHLRPRREVGGEVGGAIWAAFLAAFVLAGFTAGAYAELVTSGMRNALSV